MRKTMKKTILILLAALTAPLSAAAQEHATTTALGMKALRFEREAQNVEVEIEMGLDGRRIRRTERWEVTPTVQSGAQVHELPPIVVSGRHSANIHKRAQRLGNSRVEYGARNAAVDEVIHRPDRRTVVYRTQLPWQPWMRNAALGLNTRLIACSRVYNFGEKLTAMTLVEVPAAVVAEPAEGILPRASYMAPVRAVKVRDITKAAYIDFRVNRTEIDQSLNHNAEQLREILSTLDAVHANPDLTITNITLRGYASPEGSWANNDRLASARVNVLRNYVAANFTMPAGDITVSHVAEDWEGLRTMVEKSNLPAKERIIDVIDSPIPPDAREAALKSLGGGVWQTMLRDMMPPLRRTEYRVEFNVREYDLDDSRKIFRENPEMLSFYELDQLARQYPPNSQEYDRIYNIIEVQNPDDDNANVNVAAYYIAREDWVGAAAALSRVKNRDAAYWNNIGVVNMMTGGYKAAEEDFRKANNADAQHNIRLLEEMTKE